MLGTLARKPFCRLQSIPHQPTNTMGDKSPKANQKKSSQKQVKASSASQAKKQASAKK
jgi:hypothetical protein